MHTRHTSGEHHPVPPSSWEGIACRSHSSPLLAAFNVGNAAGAWLGGLTISAGLGYASTIWDGAALSFGALVVLLVADRLARLARRPPRRVP